MKHNDRLIQTNLTSSCNSPSFHVLSIVFGLRSYLIALALTQHIAVLLEWAADELRLLPQIRRQKPVGVRDGDEGGLERVFERLGRAGGSSVDVVDTCELKQTLDGWRGDQTSTTWSRDELRWISMM